MTEEIEKLYEEFDQIMDDMRKVQREEQGGDKLIHIREKVDEISAQVEANEQKEIQLSQDIEKAVAAEKKLKEDLHIARNEQAIRNAGNNKRENNWNGMGFKGAGGQKTFNNNSVRRSR